MYRNRVIRYSEVIRMRNSGDSVFKNQQLPSLENITDRNDLRNSRKSTQVENLFEEINN